MRANASATTFVVTVVAAFVVSTAFAEDAYDIRQIQRDLITRGYNIGTADGLWGRRSINALAAFQKAQGLPATGELNDVTVKKLLEKLQPEVTTSASPPPVAVPAQALVIEPTPPVLPSNATSRPPEAEVPAIAVPPPRVMPAPTSAKSSGATGAGWLAAGVMAIAVIFLLVRRRRTTRTLQNASATSASRVSAGQNARLSSAPSPPRKNSGAPPGVNPQPKPEAATGHMSPDLKASIAAHNAQVGKAITVRAVEDMGLSAVAAAVSLESPSTGLPLPARYGALPGALKSLAAHNASVGQAIRDAKAKNKGRSFIERLAESVGREQPPPPDSWIPTNQTVTIGKHVIPAGLIYVGNRLPQSGNIHQTENCLINPRLAIGRRGDPGGDTMGYWPSYSEITAEARRSYLDWLAGPRSDPSTYIGYVFLYFYGLERRLMLDGEPSDAMLVVEEVRRLLQIFGEHNSFRRYAQELLSAYELQSTSVPELVVPGAGLSGYEVPLSIKAALGARVRDVRAIEPDLLLAYVMSHPETSVRTPARRALDELRELFALELGKRHPNGLIIAANRARRLTSSYRACSGTFEREVALYGGDLPDISGDSRPLILGRELLETCTVQLDDYSRAVGRATGGLTLAILAKLPISLRQQRANLAALACLEELESLCEGGKTSDLGRLRALIGTEDGSELNRAKNRELAGILASFGYGITADPAFAVRTVKATELVVVFRLTSPTTTLSDLSPSEGYSHVQATLMLALLVATADGGLEDSEREALKARIVTSEDLAEDEKRRLMAELTVHASAPSRLTDWMKRLKDLKTIDKGLVADTLVAAAAADGRIDPTEVALLEKLFARLDLEASALYTRLHGGIAASNAERDSDLPTVLAAGQQPTVTPIPPPPAVVQGRRPAVRVDLSRLEAIRRETRSASDVLANIFAEDEEALQPELTVPTVPKPTEDALFEGLEGRYGCLLGDLAERDEWTVADFEQLSRQAGLMAGAVRQVLNDWSLDRFDELLLEGADIIVINRHLLPPPELAPSSISVADSRVSA